MKTNKKIFIFLLFFTIAYFIFQPFTLAATDPNNTDAVASDYKDISKCESKLGMFESVAAAIADIILYLPKQIAYWVTWIASWVISMVLDWSITNTSTNDGAALAFHAGWKSIRDVSNMLIVLGFVIIGIAFTLRLENYGSKKTLINLIIIALLINFSGIFCGFFIDLSKFAMTGLVEGTPSSMGITFYSNIQNKETTAACEALESGNLGEYIMNDVLFGVIYAIVAFCFAYLAVVLIARYAYLGILYILSPLAFICWAFPIPKLKDVWNKWWSEFLKWVFIGVSICLFLNIAGKMLDSFPSLNDKNVTISTLLFYMLIVIITIIVGIKISIKQTGVASLAAKGVLGVATGGAKLAMGAVGLGAGMTGLKGLAQRGGQKAQDLATKAGEKLRFVPKGTTALNQQNRLKESTERLGKAYGDDTEGNASLAKIASQRAVTAKQREDKASAAKILAERKAFDKIEPNQREGVAAHATAMGVSKDTFTKVRPETFAAGKFNDDESRQKVIADETKKYVAAGMTPGIAYQKVMEDMKDPNKSQMSTKNLQKAQDDLRERRTTENALGIGQTTDTDVRNKIIEDRQTEIIKKAKASGKRITPEDALKQASAMSIGEGQMTITRENLSQERIQKAIGKLDGGKIPDLPKNILSSSEFGENVGYSALSRALPRLSGEKSEEIQKLVPVLKDKILSELNLQANATVGQVKAEIAKLRSSAVAAEQEKAKKIQSLSDKYTLLKS